MGVEVVITQRVNIVIVNPCDYDGFLFIWSD